MTHMTRWLAVLALLSVTGCARGLDRLKPTLDASDSGIVSVVTDEGDVLSGDLTVPSG